MLLLTHRDAKKIKWIVQTPTAGVYGRVVFKSKVSTPKLSPYLPHYVPSQYDYQVLWILTNSTTKWGCKIWKLSWSQQKRFCRKTGITIKVNEQWTLAEWANSWREAEKTNMDPCAANDLSNHTVYINHLLRASVDFVGKVMSLLFNMLPRFVIAFLPRSKCLLILWL